MKRIKLKLEHNFDFMLFGLVSKSKDYTIAWSINKVLRINLKKSEDLTFELGNHRLIEVSNFEYKTEYNVFSLYNNRLIIEPSQRFLPKQNTFDCILKIEELEKTLNFEDIFRGLRDAMYVESVVKLDVDKIKEKHLLLPKN